MDLAERERRYMWWHPAVRYVVRCNALRDRGLSGSLVRDLKAAGDFSLLGRLEATTDEQVAAVNALAR